MNLIVFYRKNKVLSIILIVIIIGISVVALNISVGLLLILVLWINNKKIVKKGKVEEERPSIPVEVLEVPEVEQEGEESENEELEEEEYEEPEKVVRYDKVMHDFSNLKNPPVFNTKYKNDGSNDSFTIERKRGSIFSGRSFHYIVNSLIINNKILDLNKIIYTKEHIDDIINKYNNYNIVRAWKKPDGDNEIINNLVLGRPFITRNKILFNIKKW